MKFPRRELLAIIVWAPFGISLYYGINYVIDHSHNRIIQAATVTSGVVIAIMVIMVIIRIFLKDDNETI